MEMHSSLLRLADTHVRTRIRLLAAAIAICFVNASHAIPLGPQIAAGSASFNQAGNALTINNSRNAILNWQSFNVAANESVRFNQPSASSSVLNRVLANEPSALLGQLSSNGRVWLVNPAGILIGPGARIDTAGFVASTLNVRNEDFLAGKLNFQNTSGAGSVVNQGSISTPDGGSVYLVAPSVSNEGIISTPQGETILAAGQTVQLLDTATPGVKVEVTGAAGNVTNLGNIVADAGRVGMVGVLVRNSGNLNASSVVNEGGRIFLRASKDAYVDKNANIIATGSKGGTIEVLGNRVAVLDNAQIDASGRNGGGSVLVGGDYQGKNQAIQNSQVTYFGANTGIKADAADSGDGGKVIVWADDTTRAYGDISARGGERSGNGGFVETSGKRFLDFQAGVDTRSPHGQVGTLLLDPTSIYIANTQANATSAGMTGTDITADQNSPSILAGGTAPDSLLTVNNLQLALSTSAVTVSTTNAIAAGNGDIVVVDLVSWASANKLTLSADRSITINATLTGSNAGLSLLAAGSAGAITGGAGITANQLEIVSAGSGGVNLSAANHVNTLAANLTGAGASLTFENAAPGTGLSIGSAGGTTGISAPGQIIIHENNPGANISVNETVNSPGNVTIGVVAGSGTVSVAAGKGVISGSAAQLYSTGGNITINGNVTGSTSANIHAGTGTISTGSTGLVTSSSITLQNDPTVGGAIGPSGTPFKTSSNGGSGNANLSIGAAGYGPSAVYLSHTGDVTLQSVSTQASAPIDIGTTNNLTAASIATTGNLNLSAGSQLTIPALTSLSGANATLGGDLINISAVANPASINAGSGVVWLHPSTSGRPIDLGAKAGLVNTLELSTNELNTITAGTLRVGGFYNSLSAGSINVSAAIAPTSVTGANTGVLALESGGDVTQAGAGTISANNLAIKVSGNVLLGTLANSVSNIAASVGTGNNNFSFKSGIALNVASSLGGLNGISMPGFVNPNGVISLVSSGAITQTAGSLAMLSGSSVYASGTSVTLPNANPTGVIAGATTSGDFLYHSANGIAVTTVAGVNGITVQGVSNVKLTADANGISLNQPINGGSGTFTLDAGAGGFNNNAGTTPMITAGRWLVYAGSPSTTVKNGLTSNFRHYNATFANYSNPGETGNGFIYATIPGVLSVNTILKSGAASNTYGQTPTAVFGFNLVGTFDKDDLSGTAIFNPAITSTTSAGSYSVTYAGGLTSTASFSGSTLANPVSYSFTPGTALAYVVNPAALSISALLTGTTSKTYDGLTSATLTPGNFLLSGFVAGDSASVTKTSGTYASKNVGSNIQVSTSLVQSDFSPGGSTNLANYILPTSATGNIGGITPAKISISGLQANDKVYDATTAATLSPGAAGLIGVISGDSVIVGASSASFADKNVGTAKPVTVSGISLSGIDAANYILTSSTASATASITPASISVSGLMANDKVYDATTAATLGASAAMLAGVISGDSVALVGTASGSFIDKNVGIAKPVTVSGMSLSGADAGNYVLASPKGLAANITPATINNVSGISANDKVYDGNTSAALNIGSATFNGMISGDVLAVGSASGNFGDKNVGTGKKVGISGIVLAGLDAGNYILGDNTAVTTASITPAIIANVNGIAANDKPYDGNTSATLSTGNATFNGMISGDVLAVGSASGNFSDNSVGSGKTVSITGITLAGPDSVNYSLANNTASTQASITQALNDTLISNTPVKSNLDQVVNTVNSSTQPQPDSAPPVLPPPPPPSPTITSSLPGQTVGGSTGEFGGSSSSSLASSSPSGSSTGTTSGSGPTTNGVGGGTASDSASGAAGGSTTGSANDSSGTSSSSGNSSDKESKKDKKDKKDDSNGDGNKKAAAEKPATNKPPMCS